MTEPRTLLTRLRDLAASAPDGVAVEDETRALSFAVLWARTRQVAMELEKRGLAGRRIGLFVRDGPSWTEAFTGCLASNGTAVALSPLHPAHELQFMSRTAGVRGVLVSRDLEERARRTFDDTDIVVVGDMAGAHGDVTERGLAVRPWDTALALFTSGTTGKPKCALLTHDNVLALAEELGQAWGFSSGDVLLHTLPLHHLHGIGVSLLVALAAGATTRFVSFEPGAVWESLGRATVLMGVPTQHKKLFDAFDAAADDTKRRWTEHGKALRLVTSGSAALPTAVGERWRALSGRYPLERYGMTEIGIVLSNPLEGERRPGTVGKPLGGVQTRFVGEDGEDVPYDQAGELWIRARTVFAGYDENAEATRDAFAGDWFKTGDTARVAPDGYVTILGRTSVDILKSGGYKLSALEIENAFRENDDVADIAVVGLPDDTWGDLVVAAVVWRSGRAISEESLREWAKGRMAPYKVPKRIVMLEDLPRNALGKVQKNALVPLLLERIRSWT